MIVPLAAILDHVNGDARAALRRIHALCRYHENASNNCRENGDEFQAELHSEKLASYKGMAQQLEDQQ